MNTWISHALAALASLAACCGFVPSAQAQAITFRPAAVTVNMAGNPFFEVTYRNTLPGSVCSPRGNFNTEPLSTGTAVTLGSVNRNARAPGMAPLLEQVIVPAGVIGEVKGRRITRPVYYTRSWTGCTLVGAVSSTEVPITFISFSVAAIPIMAHVATGNDTLVPVRWKATFDNGVSSRVESKEGRFVDGTGRVYGSAVREVLQATGGSPLEFNETLRVPESVVKAILAAGGESGMRYERVFTLDGVQAIGALKVQFAGRFASLFGIDRAELRFLDGSRFKTVPLGEEVQVAADITFSGSGRLQGSWDLAGPTTTPGAAIFVRKELVDEYLSFGRRTLIRSPAIKAEQQGTYVVRLSITSPNLGEEGILQLSYVVRATGDAVEISLGLPPPLARLAPGLAFTWEAVAGAQNYLLEFYEVPSAEGREPKAGMVLPGGASRATLSQATERNFQPGRTYWWRVVALGPNGVLLGQSALRELLTSQE